MNVQKVQINVVLESLGFRGTSLQENNFFRRKTAGIGMEMTPRSEAPSTERSPQNQVGKANSSRTEARQVQT